jgi:hypothetical protein
VLECDHIHPISKGGTDDDENLATACWDCNSGKRAKLLSDRSPKPDANLEYLAIQQEVEELRRFLAAKERREELTNATIAALMDAWCDEIASWALPQDHQWKTWLQANSAEELFGAIQVAGPKFKSYYIEHTKIGVVKYISGILKNKRREREIA